MDVVDVVHGYPGQGLHGQGMPGQGCMGTAGQSAQASTGRSQEVYWNV